MSIIEENAKTIKDWLKHLDFEHEHPGYGKDKKRYWFANWIYECRTVLVCIEGNYDKFVIHGKAG